MIINFLIIIQDIMKNNIDIILNPIRVRIIQEISMKKSITANELCEIINDVSRTTLYRHIKVLIENSIISVQSERKIRGSVERTFILNIEELSRINSLENAPQNALDFLKHKYVMFQKYFASESVDPIKDKIFFGESVMMLNDQEFDQFITEMWELFQKYNFEYSDGRKARNISIISSVNDRDQEV